MFINLTYNRHKICIQKTPEPIQNELNYKLANCIIMLSRLPGDNQKFFNKKLVDENTNRVANISNWKITVFRT